jgi:hypothetical protein
MEPDKNITDEADKSTYKLKSDIDTPAEELQDLRTSSKRKNALLLAAAIFVMTLSCILWWILSRQ